MKIEVVNMHYQECDVRIDRTTRYGNRVRVVPGLVSRPRAVRAFEESLSKGTVDALRRECEATGKDVVRLGCWCAPRACHGDVYKRLLERG